MPKFITQSFFGGLSESERIGREDQYAYGIEVDPDRYLGYIAPGLSATVLGGSQAAVSAAVYDMVVDRAAIGGVTRGYAIGNGGRFYTFDINNDSVSAGGIRAIPSATIGYSIEMYSGKLASAQADYVYYTWKRSDGVYDVGLFNRNATWDDDFMSTLPVGKVALQSTTLTIYPLITWQTYLWIGNGRYLAKYDGITGNGGHGTFYPQQIDLGYGWEITAFFTTNNYIGICASKSGGLTDNYCESAVFLYDGVSPTWLRKIPVDDNIINAAINQNGTIYLLTFGRESAGAIRILTDTGTIKIKELKHDIGSTATDFRPSISPGIADEFESKVIFGTAATTGKKDFVWQVGKKQEGYPVKLTIPGGGTGISGSGLACVKSVAQNKIYIFGYNGTGYYVRKLSSGNSARAVWKGIYRDFGQKIRVNYIKFYFKPLVSGDSITPTLDLDYGTSFTLKDPRGNSTIAYANDGAITSKKFKVGKDCHAVRPILSWTAGGTPFSKIVIDYDFLPEDN